MLFRVSVRCRAGHFDAPRPAPGRVDREHFFPITLEVAPRAIGQVTYAGRFRLTGLAIRFDDGSAASRKRSSSCPGSGPSARVVLAGRSAVQRVCAASAELRKTPCYDCAHDELTNRRRIAQLLRSPFRYARSQLVPGFIQGDALRPAPPILGASCTDSRICRSCTGQLVPGFGRAAAEAKDLASECACEPRSWPARASCTPRHRCARRSP